MVGKRLGHAALAVYGVLHRDAVNHGLVARLQSPVEARVKTIVAGSGRYTGHQDHELRGGADVARKEQRKALDVFRRDRLLDLSGLKVQGRGVRQHLYRLDRGAERELDVDPHALVDVDLDALLEVIAEPLAGHAQLVHARLQIGKGEQAVRTRGGALRVTG